jgi:hypothetical protein
MVCASFVQTSTKWYVLPDGMCFLRASLNKAFNTKPVDGMCFLRANLNKKGPKRKNLATTKSSHYQGCTHGTH